MTNEAWLGILRHIITAAGAIALALGVSQGVVETGTSLALTIVGALLPVASMIWSSLRKTDTSVVAQASAVSGVTGMTVATPELAEAAASGDGRTVVKMSPAAHPPRAA